MSFGPFELLIVLIIVVLLFGTKKLRSLGGDIGDAIKNFRKAVKDTNDDSGNEESASSRVIEGEVDPKSDQTKDEN